MFFVFSTLLFYSSILSSKELQIPSVFKEQQYSLRLQEIKNTGLAHPLHKTKFKGSNGTIMGAVVAV